MRSDKASTVAVSFLIGAAVSTGAAAAAESQGSATGDLEEVVVTGTHIRNPGYEAPTPVTAVTAEQLLDMSPSTIADGLKLLPSLSGQSILGGRTYCCAAGTAAAGSFLELRQMGPNRTLVLLDGNRITPSTSSGLVNVDILPELLLERVDVVTGGASAAYGSDAVAGVVNYITKRDFEGVTTNLQYGISGHSDDQRVKAAVAGGTSVLDGRGHLTAAFEHYSADGIDNMMERPQSAKSWVLAGAGTEASPYYDVADTRFYIGTTGGMIVGSYGLPINIAGLAPLAGIKFLPGGEFGPADLGTILPPGAPNAIGGDGYTPAPGMQPLGELDMDHVYARFDYEFAPSLEGYVQVIGASNVTQNAYGFPAFSGNSASLVEIFSGNPFIPADLQETMTTNGYGSFFMTRANRDLGGSSYNRTETKYYDISVGLHGALAGDWTWDAHLGYGHTKQDGAEHNSINVPHLLAAVDAVQDESGNVVCNVTLTSPGSIYDDCVPINLFGVGSPSPEAVAYVSGTNASTTTTAQTVLDLVFQGTLFELPAGNMLVAAGTQWRTDELSGTSNPVATDQVDPATIRGRSMNVLLCPTPASCRYGGWIQGNVGAQEHVTDTVKEVFLETTVPVASGLQLDGAFRHTEYSNSGGVNTWKLGLNFQPVEDIRFRASVSRDIRAPNLYELFASPSTGFAAFTVNPFTGNQIPTIPTITAGNPDLQPETGDTYTVGLVFTPTFWPDLKASIDYYDVTLEDGIVTAQTASVVLQNCFDGDQGACDLIEGDPATDSISSIRLIQTNAGVQHRAGIDLDVTYALPSLRFRLLANYIVKADSETNGVVTKYAGRSTPGMPEWRAVFDATYDRGPFSFGLQERYIGSLKKVGPTGGGVFVDPTLSDVFYTNLTASYDFEAAGANVQLYGTVNNVFDEEPPLLPTTLAGVGYPTVPNLYDLVGRYFSVGVRASW
jgi:iron complex outermembrane receptor protein